MIARKTTTNIIEYGRSRTTKLRHLRWGWGRAGRLGEKGRWGWCVDNRGEVRAYSEVGEIVFYLAERGEQLVPSTVLPLCPITSLLQLPPVSYQCQFHPG